MQKSCKNSCRGSGHWSSRIRAWVKGAIAYPHPDSPNMTISPHLVYYSHVLSTHPHHIYTHFFFSEMLRIIVKKPCPKFASVAPPALHPSSFMWPLIPKYSVCFLKSKTCSYITTLQSSKSGHSHQCNTII